MSEIFLERREFKTLKEVQEALAASFPSNKVKMKETKKASFPYIPVEWIKERLITVLGIENFDVEYSNIVHHDEDWITCDCTITVDFRPWGGRVKRVTQSDGLQIARHNSGDNKGLIVDLGNSYKSVRSSAFAKAAQELGVGLYLQFSTTNPNSNSNHQSSRNYGQSNNPNNPATANQKNAAKKMEERLKLNQDTKVRLMQRLFPQHINQALQNPTYDQMDQYIKTLKPVCDIIYAINKAAKGDKNIFEAKKKEVLGYLGKQFGVQINGFHGLLTLANNEIVSQVHQILAKAV